MKIHKHRMTGTRFSLRTSIFHLNFPISTNLSQPLRQGRQDLSIEYSLIHTL